MGNDIWKICLLNNRTHDTYLIPKLPRLSPPLRSGYCPARLSSNEASHTQYNQVPPGPAGTACGPGADLLDADNLSEARSRSVCRAAALVFLHANFGTLR